MAACGGAIAIAGLVQAQEVLRFAAFGEAASPLEGLGCSHGTGVGRAVGFPRARLAAPLLSGPEEAAELLQWLEEATELFRLGCSSCGSND
jgi:hypothetical protein